MQTLLEPKTVLKTGWTSGYNIYRLYCAMKGHIQGTFDITKYGAKTNASLDAYNKRTDKIFFERLSKKLNTTDCYHLILYNLVGNPDCLSYELSGSDAYHYYLKHQGRLDRIRQIYQEEVGTIFSILKKSKKSFKNLLTGDGHPVILQLLIQERVSIETLLLIDSFLPILEEVNKNFKDDMIWTSWYTKIVQYRKLLNINSTLAKDLFISTKNNLFI